MWNHPAKMQETLKEGFFTIWLLPVLVWRVWNGASILRYQYSKLNTSKRKGFTLYNSIIFYIHTYSARVCALNEVNSGFLPGKITLCFLCVQAVSHKLIIVPNMETMRNIIEIYIYIYVHKKKTPTSDTDIPSNFCPLSIPFISHIFLHSPVFSDGSYCASLKNLRPWGAWKCAVATDQDSIMKQPWPQVK